MKQPKERITYRFPALFNLIIGNYSCIEEREISNGMLEITINVDKYSRIHFAFERLNDAVISEEIWEKHLKDNYEDYVPDYDLTPPVHPEERKGI